MEEILKVSHLCKYYDKFRLEDVSFAVRPKTIMGLIGRNGAGKTTTIKSILGLAHPDSGQITFFGMDFAANQPAIKQRIGYTCGGTTSYQRRRLSEISAVVRRFYSQWDETAYESYMERFNLDPAKKLQDLSAGMKVKFDLVLAMSHHAEFLLLDEPTSGLDPVSREELLEIFISLAEKGCAIMFSTHITTDLDKCGDEITYIQKGRLLSSGPLDAFIGSYRLIDIPPAGILTADQRSLLLGQCRQRTKTTALIAAADQNLFADFAPVRPGLEDIMVHLEAEEN